MNDFYDYDLVSRERRIIAEDMDKWTRVKRLEL